MRRRLRKSICNHLLERHRPDTQRIPTQRLHSLGGAIDQIAFADMLTTRGNL